MKIPNDAYVIIIGAAKCGTSSLYDYIAQHPKVCPCRTKEPEFFSEHQNHGLAVDHYEDLWDFDPTTHLYCIEASTGYTKYPYEQGVAKRIHEYGIRPKLIYIMRNPFDRIVSHVNFMRKSDAAWTLQIDDPHLIALSSYYAQLAQYHAHFADILLLTFGDLVATPDRVMARVFSYLGLEQHDTQFAAKNVSRSKLERRIAPLTRRLPHPAQKFLSSAARKFEKKETLTPDQQYQIQILLQDDMARLNTLGLDVSKWGFSIRSSGNLPNTTTLVHGRKAPSRPG